MSNATPPSEGENQNWPPPPPPPQQPPQQPYPQQPYPQQPPYQQQPQQPPYQQPPPPMQPQQYAPPPPPAHSAPPRPMPTVNMQNVNQLIKSVPQLVRALRYIAWVELIAVVALTLISACSTLISFGGFYASSWVSLFTNLVVTVLQALVYWGLLMGAALLLEKQSDGRAGA